MIRLLELPDGAARPALPADRDVVTWHQALADAIATHLTPAHAALLATPTRGEQSTAWYAPGTALRRFGEFDAGDRDRLTAAARVILSDIRRLAESEAAPAVTAAWPALRTIPDLNHLFAVDGRPVLAAWGFAAPVGGVGPLAALDDGVPWRRPPYYPWPVYGGALAALAGLALLVGLLLPPLGGLFLPAEGVCRIAPGQLALLLEQSREAARADVLRAALAQVEESRGEQALNCPIPHAVAPPPAPPPTPPSHADLPEDRWNQHDLGMLQGCWQNDNDLSVVELGTGRVHPQRRATLCFDGHGHGQQTITLTDGDECSNGTTASFDRSNDLVMDDRSRCRFRNGLPLIRGRWSCKRESDTEAICTNTLLEGNNRGDVATGRFHRSDAPAPPTGR